MDGLKYALFDLDKELIQCGLRSKRYNQIIEEMKDLSKIILAVNS